MRITNECSDDNCDDAYNPLENDMMMMMMNLLIMS